MKNFKLRIVISTVFILICSYSFSQNTKIFGADLYFGAATSNSGGGLSSGFGCNFYDSKKVLSMNYQYYKAALFNEDFHIKFYHYVNLQYGLNHDINNLNIKATTGLGAGYARRSHEKDKWGMTTISGLKQYFLNLPIDITMLYRWDQTAIGPKIGVNLFGPEPTYYFMINYETKRLRF